MSAAVDDSIITQAELNDFLLYLVNHGGFGHQITMWRGKLRQDARSDSAAPQTNHPPSSA